MQYPQYILGKHVAWHEDTSNRHENPFPSYPESFYSSRLRKVGNIPDCLRIGYDEARNLITNVSQPASDGRKKQLSKTLPVNIRWVFERDATEFA